MSRAVQQRVDEQRFLGRADGHDEGRLQARLGDKKTEAKIGLYLFGCTTKKGKEIAGELREGDVEGVEWSRPMVRWTWRCATWESFALSGTFGGEFIITDSVAA